MADPLVSARWLAGQLNKAVVLDATATLAAPRADGDYRVASGRPGWLAGHIPGSRHADLVTELTDHGAGFHFAHLEAAALAAVVRPWGVVQGRPVVIYDQAGSLWAARLWWELRSIGVDARVLDGGLAAWRAAGLPVAVGDDAPAPRRGYLEPRETPGAWATRDDVLAVISGHSRATLVCALGADAFTGRATTRYSRRGHIPASANLPAHGLLDGDGRLLEPAALSAAAAAVLPRDGGRIILYCGGGVSAALLALALTVIGVGGVAIYDGSLEEWTADPALPIQLGVA